MASRAKGATRKGPDCHELFHMHLHSPQSVRCVATLQASVRVRRRRYESPMQFRRWRFRRSCWLGP